MQLCHIYIIEALMEYIQQVDKGIDSPRMNKRYLLLHEFNSNT